MDWAMGMVSVDQYRAMHATTMGSHRAGAVPHETIGGLDRLCGFLLDELAHAKAERARLLDELALAQWQAEARR